MKYFIAILILIISNCSLANSVDASAKAEIDHLFVYLERSGCEFNRNGSWHTAVDAAKHLKTKYDYLIKKDMLTNAESFIEKAASKSSISGKAYQVRCSGSIVVNSKEWFSEELVRFRKNDQ